MNARNLPEAAKLTPLEPLPEQPLVSIVMPAYNAAATIGDSVRSVLSQSYPHWELLIVDDGSRDSTKHALQPFRDEPRVRLLATEGQCGPARARNLALQAATGRLVAFLDSDDLWSPTKLERQVAFMRKTGAAISCTAYETFRSDGNGPRRAVHVPAVASYADLLKGNTIGCLTAMIDRQRFPNAAMPDFSGVAASPMLRRLIGGRIGHEDYAFWLGLVRDDPAGSRAPILVHGLDEKLASYRMGHASLSSNKRKAALFQWFVYRSIERLPIWAALYFFMHYAWRGIRRNL